MLRTAMLAWPAYTFRKDVHSLAADAVVFLNTVESWCPALSRLTVVVLVFHILRKSPEVDDRLRKALGYTASSLLDLALKIPARQWQQRLNLPDGICAR